MRLAVERLLSIREVAPLLGIGVRTLYRWMEAGYVPRPLRSGLATKRLRWRKSVGEAWMEHHGLEGFHHRESLLLYRCLLAIRGC